MINTSCCSLANYELIHPFEDFSVVGKTSSVVCDGCSTGLQTDIGARILGSLALKELESNYEQSSKKALQDIIKDVTAEAEHRVNYLGYGLTTLLSTLLFTKYDSGEFYTAICGDGLLALKLKNEDIYNVFDIEYKSESGESVPFYSAYLMHPNVQKKFEELNITKFVNVHTYDNSKKAITDSWTYNTSEYIECFMSSAEVYDAAIIMSDGIKAIMDESRNLVSLEDSIKEFLNFPSMADDFVTRKMHRLFKTKIKKGKWITPDDISMAAVVISDEKDSNIINESNISSEGQECICPVGE